MVWPTPPGEKFPRDRRAAREPPQAFGRGQPEPVVACRRRDQAGAGALNAGLKALAIYEHFMDMAEYGSDGACAVAGRLGAPRTQIEVLDYDLVHPTVYGVPLRESLTHIERNSSLRPGRRLFLFL